MSITREQKGEILRTYTELIQKSEALILIEYKGLSQKGIDPLRRKIREASGELHIVKNTLARLAHALRTPLTELLAGLEEQGRPTATARRRR